MVWVGFRSSSRVVGGCPAFSAGVCPFSAWRGVKIFVVFRIVCRRVLCVGCF